MSNLVAMQTPTPIRPRDYTGEQLALIRRTVAKDTTPDEFSMFMEVCRRVGLDPFRRQIYCLVYNAKNKDKRSVSFITGIDGFRACAARNGDYTPDPVAPRIVIDESAKDPDTNPLGIVSATVAPLKMDDNGKWHPIEATVYWEEFAPLKERWENNQPTGKFYLDRKTQWPRMPRIMLAKCAEAQALRKGWPEDLSGVYAPEEMDQARTAEMNAAEAADAAEEEARLIKVHAKDAVPFVWTYGGGIEFTPIGQVADKVLAFIQDNDAAQVDWFSKTNVEGLRQFWALAPSDALEVKKAIEAASRPTLPIDGGSDD